MLEGAQFLVIGALGFAAAVSAASQAAQVGYWDVQDHTCTSFASVNWDDVKYTCAWEHNWYGQIHSNIFIKRYNGNLESDCFCSKGLATYDPWGSRWTWSQDASVTCYTRDGKKASEVQSEFDSINCPAVPVKWVGPPYDD
ncbi:hypothetical protein Gpo141_00014098 [Globisporangium polare]